MKILGQVSVIMWVAVTMVMVMVMCTVNGRRVDVGGRNGWTNGVNYTVWASQEIFYVHDWLLFRFDKNYYDVLEVNQTSYKNCNADHFIANITHGGRDVLELKEARPYYFICSKGYCFNGMKVAINVTNAPLPAPSPKGNDAVSLLYGIGSKDMLPVLVIAVSVLAFLIRI